jgi:hypothetical protein
MSQRDRQSGAPRSPHGRVLADAWRSRRDPSHHQLARQIKADDPDRRQIVELFEVWHAHHAERPIKAADLAGPVRALIEPQGRGRQHIETRLTHTS